MTLDKELLFSEDQDIGVAAGTVVSTNIIDLGAANTIPALGGTVPKDAGASPLQLFMQITETVTSGGSATVQFQVCESDNSDGSSPVVLCETLAIAYATLVAGYQPRIAAIPRVTKRYLLTRYIVAVATTTAGMVTAGLVLDKQTAPGTLS